MENNNENKENINKELENVTWEDLNISQVKLLSVMANFMSHIIERVENLNQIAGDLYRKVSLIAMAYDTEEDLIKKSLDKIFAEEDQENLPKKDE